MHKKGIAKLKDELQPEDDMMRMAFRDSGLATDGNDMMVDYVTDAISQQQSLTVYQTCLPDTDVLQAQLQQLLDKQEQQR